MQRRTKQAIVTIALVAMVAVWTAGCPKGTLYHDAVVAEHQFKTVVGSFQQAEMKEFQNGRIDATEHQKIEAGIEKVGLAAQTLVSSLQNGAVNATVQQNFDTLSGALTELLNNGVLGIKNAQSQALVKTLIETAQAILANVNSLLTQSATTPGALPAKKGV